MRIPARPAPRRRRRLVSPPCQLARSQQVNDSPVRVRLPGQELFQISAGDRVSTGHDLRFDLLHRALVWSIRQPRPAARTNPTAPSRAMRNLRRRRVPGTIWLSLVLLCDIPRCTLCNTLTAARPRAPAILTSHSMFPSSLDRQPTACSFSERADGADYAPHCRDTGGVLVCKFRSDQGSASSLCIFLTALSARHAVARQPNGR